MYHLTNGDFTIFPPSDSSAWRENLATGIGICSENSGRSPLLQAWEERMVSSGSDGVAARGSQAPETLSDWNFDLQLEELWFREDTVNIYCLALDTNIIAEST